MGCLKRLVSGVLTFLAWGSVSSSAPAQTLINIDFGVGSASLKTGYAATGIGTNDHWNLYRHYEPRFSPGMPLVADGRLAGLKLSDGSPTAIEITVSNAPGVWGNASGDPMYDTYIFAQNGSNIVAKLEGLPAGRYHFFLYGHADADVTGEQNSVFSLRAGTNVFGPQPQLGGSAWRAAAGWQERAQFVVFRDVPVDGGPVLIEAAPGPNGVAVLNGLQVLSRGTAPPRLVQAAPPKGAPASTNLLIREIRYEGRVSDNEARFKASFEVESMTTNDISTPLFEGEVALIEPQLPPGLRIVTAARQTRLFCSAPGVYPVKLDVVARITRAEPWNQVSFAGPAAAIASVSATASAPGVEMELLSGTQLEPEKKAVSKVSGFLGADRTLSLRWQSKAAEVARKALVTVDSVLSAQVTPTVVKLTSRFHFEILQAALPRLVVALPPNQALTRVEGDQIRDWQVTADPARTLSPSGQVLTVEFIKPVEKAITLSLLTEQPVESTPAAVALAPPQPLGVEREAGSLTLSADDTLVEVLSVSGLRQVNASTNAIAAYRFNNRPISLQARLQRIEPALKLADRVTARLEETRLLVHHALNLTVEKAGIYALELTPQPGFVVTEARGEGIDDWKTVGGKLRIGFGARVLGQRKIDAQLEQAHQQVPEQVLLQPLAVAGATNAIVQVGAASAPGIRLKTAEVTGLRETPVTALRERTDELLAFSGEQNEWRLVLGAEKLPARVVAEVFNLVTVGDGLVGGSATIRLGILNQGLQEFRVRVPGHWKNLEFTGANIRRKEQQTNLWTLSLQDKVWGGYTLVVTYDYQFDPKGASLDLAGAHLPEAERETGSLGLMTAASLKLTPAATAGPLRRVDEAELSESDRALCTRPLLLAYKYSGTNYAHAVTVTRFDEVQVLGAVADRIELTTVVTEEGQMLTQASFMVKNNEKQFQQFKLPAGAEFWSSHVNGQPVKPERDGDWLLAPLPKGANRDQAFAVNIVYAQKIDVKTAFLPKRVELLAPLTDIPNTYAEWQLFVPASQKLTGFRGAMTVARGTTYGFQEAWNAFLDFYIRAYHEYFGLVVVGILVTLLVALVVVAARRGARGVLAALAVLVVLMLLAAMILPNFVKARHASQTSATWANIKQVGGALATYTLENKQSGSPLPTDVEGMLQPYIRDPQAALTDVANGQRFVYVGAGKPANNPDAIVLYSPTDENGRLTLFADGSVKRLSREEFNGAMQRDAGVARQAVPGGAPALTPPTVAAPSAAPAQPAPAMPRQQAVAVGGFGGGLAGPGAPQGGAVFGGAPAAATATGVRPIRIDVPRAGQAYTFTKVLNTGSEPLTVGISLMRARVYRGAMMVLQVCGFLAGLILCWRMAGRKQGGSFGMAVAAALIGGSVTSLLIMRRLLGAALILGLPSLVALGVLWLLWRWWQKRRALKKSPPPAAPPSGLGSQGLPAAGAAALLLVAALGGGVASGAGLPPLSNAVSIVSATYTGSIAERVARLEATITIASVATNQLVPLFGEDAAVESFSAEGEAKLVREGRMVCALLPGRSNVTVRCKLIARLAGDVSRRALSLGVPPALSSIATVLIDEPQADVECPTAVAFTHSPTNQQTLVRAILGASDRLEIKWTPRVKRAAEMAATVFAQNTALVTLAGGVMNVRATLDYQVSQGELKQVRVALPPGQRLLRVEGEAIRVWEVKPGAAAGEDVLLVELVKGVSPAYRLTVETEKVLERLPTTARIELPRALEVKRETGLLGLRGGEELTLTVEEARDLQRVDAAEFQRAMPEGKDGLASAFRFLKPDFALRARAETVQPQIEAVVRNQARIGSESLRVTAQIDYTIKRAGLFSLRLLLPPDYRVESIVGGPVLQWTERVESGRRYAEVALRERTTGACSLTVSLALNLRESPASLAIAGVHPLGAEKLSGFITVVTDPGLAAKTASFDGLTEVPFASVSGERSPSTGSALAYKFITPDPGAEPAWKLAVSLEAVEPWVRAEIASVVTVTETLVSGRALVKFEVANAPTKEFRLRVPAAFRNVEISGAQIRRRDQTGEQWRIELQAKVRGDYLLTVTWEQPKNDQSNQVEVVGIETVGLERETGWLSIVGRAPLQVTERAVEGLLNKIDARELPEWAGRPDPATVLAYRYLRPGGKLSLTARRFDEAEVLQALIDSARFTTVVADDGQMMTELSLSIRNNGRQYLEIDLPARATVWSAFVDGEPVRPSRREGSFLLPLARNAASEAPVSVELTYIGTDRFPGKSGQLRLASPMFDVPVKNARWELYLPPDYDYSRFEGSMSRTADAATPLVQVYSLAEYNVQQRNVEQQKVAAAKSEIQDFRSNLKTGNLGQVMSGYNRAKFKGAQMEQQIEEARDLKEIERDVRRAQSSNLILAQNNFAFENSVRLGDAQQAPAQYLNAPAQAQQQARQPTQQAGEYLNVDAEVAGQQWDKLEKAQQVTVARVAPLRVNLPTRGLRYAFAQVLQTELRKPMTIQFHAANVRQAGWFSRLGLGLLGFLALWGVVGAFRRRARKHAWE